MLEARGQGGEVLGSGAGHVEEGEVNVRRGGRGSRRGLAYGGLSF
jgi:hypothetical protein